MDEEFTFTIHAKKDIDEKTLRALMEMALHLAGTLSIEKTNKGESEPETTKLIQCPTHKSQIYKEGDTCPVCNLWKV